jgi:secreted PhoX family phosphatase
MGRVDRRAFLKGAAATTGGVLVGGSLQALVASVAGAAPPDRFRTLGPVADLRDNKVRLHLPPGFRYRSFHDTDGPAIVLDDGTRLPGRHDGMAAFPGPGGNVWLVRNHEVNGSALGGAFGPGTPYDSSALGGTTTTLVTPFGEAVEAWTSINGTQMNCAGGGMPWGSWITCEETINGPDVFDDFTRNPPPPAPPVPPTTYIQNARLTKPHGFIFEVPAGGQSNRQPIMHAGRFAHEAAAYSPDEGYLYLTEDNFGFASGFYRYIPPSNPLDVGHLEDGGRLEMLKVVGVTNAHLEGNQLNGARYAVQWVEIENPFPGTDGRFPMNGSVPSLTNDQAITFVGDQGRAQGAAHFSRLEGAKYTRGEIYFTSTQGGGAAETVVQDDVGGYGNGTGQVWSYNPATSTLTCRYQAPSGLVLDFPDNITAKSDRGTIVLCEDGAAPNYIRGLTRDGNLFDIALNRLTRNSDGAPRFGEEFAGATFGPGTDTLYVNTQASAGITYAIWGPWGRIGV